MVADEYTLGVFRENMTVFEYRVDAKAFAAPNAPLSHGPMGHFGLANTVSKKTDAKIQAQPKENVAPIFDSADEFLHHKPFFTGSVEESCPKSIVILARKSATQQ